MNSNPLSHWLAMSQCSLAMYKQLTEAGNASLKDAAAQLPAGQAQMAQLIRSTLAMGQEWKDLQAAAFNGLLHTHLAAFKSQQQFVSIQNIVELHQVLADDLSAQRHAALKAVTERVQACIDDLHKAESKEDVSMVVGGFFDDVGNKLRANAEQTFTMLNSANAATAVLTDKALESMAAGAPPQ
jgi:hypothetical protein